MDRAKRMLSLASSLLLVSSLLAPLLHAGELNVYSARHYDADEALFRQFTEQTGIRVRVLQADSDQLIQRIRREGRASPADVLITVDAGRLFRAEQAGILDPVDSPVLATRIPEHLRHPDRLWFGFSTRARVIFYNSERIEPDQIRRYEDLADPTLANRICVRSSSNVYNQSLLASMIAAHGAAAAEEWARGLVTNLARPPQGGDTDQIRGVAAGECDIAIANHYYHARLATSADPADRAIAERVAVMFPNQADRGAHVAAGQGEGASHRPQAIQTHSPQRVLQPNHRRVELFDRTVQLLQPFVKTRLEPGQCHPQLVQPAFEQGDLRGRTRQARDAGLALQ
jgi:iron(III) transport system substrate-binding protein